MHWDWLDIRVGVQIPWFLYGGSKLTWFYCGDQTWLVLCAGVKINFPFVCGPKTTLFRAGIHWPGFCVGGQNWLAFSVGDGAWLVFSEGVELIWCLCGWSKLTWCKFKDRNWLVFCDGRKWLFYGVWIEISSIPVSWHRYRLNIREGIAIGFISAIESSVICIFVCGILMDLVLAGESKLLSFFVQSSNLTLFLCGDQKLMAFMYASKLKWFLCARRLRLGLSVDLVFVWVVGLTWSQCRKSELTLSSIYFTFVLCGGRRWLVFNAWIVNIYRFLCRGVEIYLILEWGSKCPWF